MSHKSIIHQLKYSQLLFTTNAWGLCQNFANRLRNSFRFDQHANKGRYLLDISPISSEELDRNGSVYLQAVGRVGAHWTQSTRLTRVALKLTRQKVT